MHIFFRDVRVHKRKEFFAATAEDVNGFFDLVSESGQAGEEEREHWAYALAKAEKRG
jgi:hypothetical protein